MRHFCVPSPPKRGFPYFNGFKDKTAGVPYSRRHDFQITST